jgi:hypothetical protein
VGCGVVKISDGDGGGGGSDASGRDERTQGRSFDAIAA